MKQSLKKPLIIAGTSAAIMISISAILYFGLTYPKIVFAVLAFGAFAVLHHEILPKQVI